VPALIPEADALRIECTDANGAVLLEHELELAQEVENADAA